MDFDAHAHLPEGSCFRLPEEWSGVVCAVRESEFEALVRLANAYSGIIPAFGLHPWFIAERSESWLDNLRCFLEKTPRAQVGEIGLDKARADAVSLGDQQDVFFAQLQLAASLALPAHIHCVRAWNEMLTLLRTTPQLPKLHFHAFSGSAEIAQELMRISDVSFSFSPRQKKSASEKIQKLLQNIPHDRIFSESDAPLGS